MTQWLFIHDVNLSIEEDLSIFLVKEYDMKTHIKSCHAYVTKWTSKNGEIVKPQPESENEYDKYAVAVERYGDVLDIFLKEGLHVSPKPFRIFYMQAMKTVSGLK